MYCKRGEVVGEFSSEWNCLSYNQARRGWMVSAWILSLWSANNNAWCFLSVRDNCQEGGNLCKTYPWQATWTKLSGIIQWVFVRTRLGHIIKMVVTELYKSISLLNSSTRDFRFFFTTIPEGDWFIFSFASKRWVWFILCNTCDVLSRRKPEYFNCTDDVKLLCV
jgi:hypothetical protein